MPQKFNIREEQESDRARVATLLARTYGAEGAKAIELAGELRRLPGWVAPLFLLAEGEPDALACALFAPVKVADEEKQAVVLAFVGFDTKQQINLHDFIGQAVEQVKSQGYRYVLMRGDAQEFAAQGFARTREQGLELAGSDWLVKDLQPQAGAPLAGKVQLPAVLAS
jgi:predicted N-acetyltransferase YhbS